MEPKGQNDSNLKQWKVLYMHGLESGPKGTKAKRIAQYFSCEVPDILLSQRMIFVFLLCIYEKYHCSRNELAYIYYS